MTGVHEDGAAMTDDHTEDHARSATGNEFDEPGANYPDSAKETAPEARSDAGVGGAVVDETPRERVTGTQDGSRLEQNVTTDVERLNGIVDQSRADLAGEPVDVIEKSLRRRLADAGIEVDGNELTELAQEISGGSHA